MGFLGGTEDEEGADGLSTRQNALKLLRSWRIRLFVPQSTPLKAFTHAHPPPRNTSRNSLKHEENGQWQGLPMSHMNHCMKVISCNIHPFTMQRSDNNCMKLTVDKPCQLQENNSWQACIRTHTIPRKTISLKEWQKMSWQSQKIMLRSGQSTKTALEPIRVSCFLRFNK